MLRKLMLIALCIPIVFVAANIIGPDRPLLAQTDIAVFKTETFALMSGKLVLPDGTSKGYGAGAEFKLGVRPTEYFISWVTVSERKIIDKDAEEVSEADEGKLGVSFVFPDIWPKIAMSTYATFAGGVGKVDENPVDFSKAVGGGAFFEVTNKFKIWVGLDWDNTGDMNVTSVYLGTSWNL